MRLLDSLDEIEDPESGGDNGVTGDNPAVGGVLNDGPLLDPPLRLVGDADISPLEDDGSPFKSADAEGAELLSRALPGS